MSDSEADLDDCNFEDQSFSNQLRVAGQGGAASDGQQQAYGRNMKSIGVETEINFETEDDYFFDNETNTETRGKSVAVQKDFGYVDQEQQMQDAQGFEYVGLEKWLKRIEPKVTEMLEANIKNNIFSNYKTKEIDLDGDMDDDGGVSFLKVTNRLQNLYDFSEANKAIQKNLEKQREADK